MAKPPHATSNNLHATKLKALPLEYEVSSIRSAIGKGYLDYLLLVSQRRDDERMVSYGE